MNTWHDSEYVSVIYPYPFSLSEENMFKVAIIVEGAQEQLPVHSYHNHWVLEAASGGLL